MPINHLEDSVIYLKNKSDHKEFMFLGQIATQLSFGCIK